MPVAIGTAAFAAVGAEALGATAVLGTTVAGITGNVILIAASLGASMALAPGEERRKTDPSQIAVKQSLPVRVRGYGRHKMAGAYFFLDTSAGVLWEGLVHCEGPIDAFEQWWLGGKLTPIASGSLGGPSQTYPWGGTGAELIIIESHLGTVPQAASTRLLTYFPGFYWTADHRLDGLAYSVVSYGMPLQPEKYWQRFYPDGKPPLTVVLRLSKVLDPRTSTTAWSDNPALCIMDYLVHARGFNFPLSRIDQTSFADFADICDELVEIVGPSTQKRYVLGGVYTLAEERREVLKRLLATCDGELHITPAGQVGIRGGVFETPTVTITDAMILSYSIEQGNDKFAAFNRLKFSVSSPGHDYQPTEGEAWDDLESQDQLGVLEQDLSIPMVQNFPQGRRLAKIAMHKGNPRWKGQITTTLAALDALGERIVNVQLDELGIAETFLVTRFEIAGDMSGCSIALSSLDATAYEWDAETEEGTPPPGPPDTSPELTVPGPPTAVVLANVGGDANDLRIDWTNTVTANFAAARVYRHTANVPASATEIANLPGVAGAAVSYTDVDVPAGTWFYWVRSFNPSGIGGAYTPTVPSSAVTT